MSRTRQLMYLILVVLVLFTGVCTIFALVTTSAQAWQEHAEARWPVATARVEKCSLERTSSNGSRKLYIQCRLDYTAGDEEHSTNIYSSNFPAPEIWQYPPRQGVPFAEWVDAHPEGTPIVVSYDPNNHKKIVLVTTDMPSGGPHTPNNLKVLEACAGIFLVLLVTARITRPRSPWQIDHSG